MKFSLVEPFSPPYIEWETRNPTQEEMIEALAQSLPIPHSINISPKATLANHSSAGEFMLSEVVNNGLEFHIDNFLNSSLEFNNNIELMPQDDPQYINAYKHSYPHCDFEKVSKDINDFGAILADGQQLFHGGYIEFSVGDTFVLERPFSTTFCPQVALRNADWRGKAYDQGEIHLIVLKMIAPKTKAYFFSLNGELGNEKEVLIASGLNCTVISKTLIRRDFPTYKMHGLNSARKEVPAYLIELEAQ